MQHGHLALPGSPLVTLVMARARVLRARGARLDVSSARASTRLSDDRGDSTSSYVCFRGRNIRRSRQRPARYTDARYAPKEKGPYPRRDFAPVRHLSALAFRPRHAPPPRTLPTAYAVARPPRTHRRSRWGRKPRENIVSVRHCPAVASPAPLPPRASRLGLARTTAAATPLTSRCRPPPLPARRRQVLLPRQGAGLPLPRLV